MLSSQTWQSLVVNGMLSEYEKDQMKKKET